MNSTIIKYSNVDVGEISITDLTEATYTNNFYVNYDTNKFNIQSPTLKIDWAGIPREDDYHQDEESRRYIQMGLNVITDLDITRETNEANDLRNKETTNFKLKLMKVDEMMQSDEVMTQLFGTNKKKFIYSPIVKPINDDITDDRHNPEKFKIKYYWKKEEDGGGPSFKIFEKKKNEDNTFSRTEIDTTSISDIDTLQKNYLGYQRSAKFIFSLHGWSNKKPKVKGQPMSYGVTLRLVKVEVEERKQKSVSNNGQEFIDDSDEEVIDEGMRKVNMDDNEENNDDDNDDDDDDNEENNDTEENNELDDNVEKLEEIKPKRRSRKKAAAK